jgi:mannose-6-phosphate isomerase-like protein (cupin superfamily)
MKVEKPWGYYKQYALNRTCSVRLIVLEPNQETSLHWHNLRSDLWIILDEGVKVQIGEEVHETEVGEEFFIPSEQLHRLASTGKRCRILEITFGYCIEDDIHRLADDYGRKIDL